jgi:hypothetical protein
MTGSRAVLYVLWFWFLGQAVSAQTCYFPNGQQAIHDTACTANSSICCQRGATCLGNGLCFDPFGSAVGGYIRGSCTDRSWQSSNCPQYCTYGECSAASRNSESTPNLSYDLDNKTAGLYNTLSDAGVLSCGKGGFQLLWLYQRLRGCEEELPGQPQGSPRCLARSGSDPVATPTTPRIPKYQFLAQLASARGRNQHLTAKPLRHSLGGSDPVPCNCSLAIQAGEPSSLLNPVD